MLKIKGLVLSVLITGSLFGANNQADRFTPSPYYDFGTNGKTYPILEKDILEEIRDGLANLKLDKVKIKADLIKAVEKMANYKTELPLCLSGVDYNEEEDVSYLHSDMRDRKGKLLKKSGSPITVPLPPGTDFSLCFISGKNYVSGLNQIMALGKASKMTKKCMYLVSDRDVRDYRKSFPKLDIYPSSKAQEDRFKVKCYPSKVDLYNTKRHLTQYNYSQFNN